MAGITSGGPGDTNRGSAAHPVPELGEAAQALRRGLTVGRDFAETMARRIGAWAEENPGQVLLAGLALGFVLGKLLTRRPERIIEAV